MSGRYARMFAGEKSLKGNIISILEDNNEAVLADLINEANQLKRAQLGNKVYLRGLIEYSNICKKNCFYCGIRCGNKGQERYALTETEVLEAAHYAWKNGFASLVIQSGERDSKAFVDTISSLVRNIHQKTNNELGITLSCGEQSLETYKRWAEMGVHRYLLRIEASDPGLYYKLHPADKIHSYENRIRALQNIRESGIMTGTGVMIGLPYQNVEHLAGDLIFMRDLDIDMCGMGPYIPHHETPLEQSGEKYPSASERLDLSLKMIAILRIMMPDINIASTTAMQSLHQEGRELALKAGANVLMPNVTPMKYRENYFLYENKPMSKGNIDDHLKELNARIEKAGEKIAFGEQGHPLHYFRRQNK